VEPDTRQLDRIERKVDDVGNKVEAYGQEIARHGVRLDHVEANQRQGMSFKAALTVALCGAIGGGGLGLLTNLLTR
jgi:hypothetical protein